MDVLPALWKKVSLAPVFSHLELRRRSPDPPADVPLLPMDLLSWCLPPLLCLCRSLEEAAVVAHDTVVCGFLAADAEWSLCVWRGWGGQELDVFYMSYEELCRLETDMRRRR